jgi:hypothetical protein
MFAKNHVCFEATKCLVVAIAALMLGVQWRSIKCPDRLMGWPGAKV